MNNQERSWVSHNVAGIAVSAIKEMAIRGARIPDVASLTWGLPSFRTPAYIRRAIEQRLEDDGEIGKYSLPDGLPEFREAVARTHLESTGVAIDPDRNVMITAGNMQGLNALLHALIDPGDEIIVTDPGFASHFQQIRLCGGVVTFWPLCEAEGWRLDLDALAELITPRTKALILVSPSNPTGKIFSEDELRRVGAIAHAHDIWVLLDDPYSHFTYENRDRYFNLASVAEFAERVAYLFTFSKAYAMSGWRVGYMIVPEPLKREVMKVHDATIICTPRISQVAGLVALTQPPVHLEEFEATLSSRRSLICERLDRVDHVFRYDKPEGAYYVFPKISDSGGNARDFAIDLLEKAKVIVTPGSAFGPSGENHVRMAYCVEEETINTAFDRIEAYFR